MMAKMGKDFRGRDRDETEAKANCGTRKRDNDLLAPSGRHRFERCKTAERMQLYAYVLPANSLSCRGMTEFVSEYRNGGDGDKRQDSGGIVRERATNAGHKQKHPLNANRP